ncbi:hypothetical protein ACFL02_00110 [Planctomycetota bacterium]
MSTTKQNTWVIAITFLWILITAPLGCKEKSEDYASSEGTVQVAAGSLETALEYWSQDEQDSAMYELLNVNWKVPPTLSESSVFSLKQKQFSALSPDERLLKEQEIFNTGDAIMKLGQYVCDAGLSDIAGEKKYMVAERKFNAVYNFAEFLLSDPESLDALQKSGTGLKRAALTGMVVLYEQSLEPEKLRVAQEALDKLKD